MPIHIISAHENTLVAIYILYLRGLITESNEPQSSHESMKLIIEALGSSNSKDIKVAKTTFKNALCDKNVVEKLERFEGNRKNNTTFQFLMKYKDMVTILFKFTNVFRSRNWLAHLNTLEEIVPYVTAIDTIKYRRMLPVYLSDMRALEERDPNIWQFFLNGHFSVPLNHIPGTAKGVDHAGEQESKKLNIQGGLVGITRRENSKNKFFLILHGVSEIEKELREISHSQKKETKIHHALNQNDINIQSKNKISLVSTFDTVKLQFADREDINLII